MLIDVLIPIVYIEKYLNYGDIFSKEKKNTANLPRTEYNQYVMTKIDTKCHINFLGRFIEYP